MTAPATFPLVVDLDDTLIKTDVLYESTLALLRRNPFWIAMVVLWLLRGRLYLKTQLAQRVALDPALLPYRADLLEFLKAERAAGRSLILATATHERLAQPIADHLGLFDAVLATTDTVNLKGHPKADALVKRFGERGFDYVGDSASDMAVWAVARNALVVGNLTPATPVVQRFHRTASPWKGALRAMRPHQWTKNALLFVPLLTAHQFMNPVAIGNVVLAFIAFSLCASSVYLLNDLWDLPADRAHPRKCRRPFAAGDLAICHGLLLIPLLLAAAFGLALLLTWQFLAVLAFYYACTVFYSFHGKSLLIIDVLLLAGLYTLRILAGDAALGQFTSFWLLAFSLSFFLSLAMVKRYAELAALPPTVGDLKGRGYVRGDEELLRELGGGAGYGAVLIFALYIKSPEVSMLYQTPELLWLLCPLLLYWITRVWFITHRGLMHDDPIVFALRDRTSHVIGGITLVLMLLAMRGGGR